MTFHLAIPAKDLPESLNFYQSLGFKIGRTYPSHFIMKFHGAQVVCHKSKDWERTAKMYPRHFGVIFDTLKDLEEFVDKWKFSAYVFEPYFVRESGKPEEHRTFFMRDPSNNLMEFKWYKHKEAIFN